MTVVLKKPHKSARKPKGDGHLRRGEILAAAERIFIAEGYSGATIRKIADAVGVSSTALYMHFRDKDQILMEISNDAIERLLELNTEIAVENKKRQIKEAQMDADRAIRERRRQIDQEEMAGRIGLEEKKRALVDLASANARQEADAKGYGIEGFAMDCSEAQRASIVASNRAWVNFRSSNEATLRGISGRRAWVSRRSTLKKTRSFFSSSLVRYFSSPPTSAVFSAIASCTRGSWGVLPLRK